MKTPLVLQLMSGKRLVGVELRLLLGTIWKKPFALPSTA